jgi:hypothetical protein
VPLRYAFNSHRQQSVQEPPSDWQELHKAAALAEFCCVPLLMGASVVGTVLFAFAGDGPESSGSTSVRPPSNRLPQPSFLSCDDASLKLLGNILTVGLLAQDLQLAQQVSHSGHRLVY